MNKSVMKCCICNNENIGEFITINDKKYHLCCIEQLQQENQKLKKQLEYLRNGEYYNQLRFENKMLQDIVDNGEISKEDKEFIVMTRRNTELLEENQKYKDVIDKAINNSQYWIDYYTRLNSDERIALRLQENIDILKEVK